jgi:2-dehydro-3-deoxygluconokinase
VIDLLTAGEAMVAVRAQGSLRLGGPAALSVAGAESNVAIGVARLGHATRWVGVLGDDELGVMVMRTLRAEGVDTSHVRTNADRPTGLMLRERRVGHQTRVSYYRDRSAGSTLSADDVLAAADPPPRWIHLTGITPALSQDAHAAVCAAADLAATVGARLSLDVNYRRRLWSPQRAADILWPLAARADVVIASDDELRVVAPATAADEAAQIDALLAGGVRDVVVKRGADGASLHTAAGQWAAAAHQVPVVDTVGAGDAFTAGYLSALLDDLPPADRLPRAVACGAFAVATGGDWEGLPTRNDLALLDLAAGAVLR